jgi:hypothetical protein
VPVQPGQLVADASRVVTERAHRQVLVAEAMRGARLRFKRLTELPCGGVPRRVSFGIENLEPRASAGPSSASLGSAPFVGLSDC